ncbi:alpha-galactosidase [Streptomyces sp. NPDC058335]|uniref:alpha-galactosidase n=1 Tax=Streptomyces sp. NPDC058335 TaxID=3346451 RepID=UPI00365CF2C8
MCAPFCTLYVLYALSDRLCAAHPGVAFESCSGGGCGWIGPGILSRADQVWTSDDTDPRDRLAVRHGFSRSRSARVMAAWVTGSSDTRLDGRVGSLRLRFVSAMAGVLGVGGDLSGRTAGSRPRRGSGSVSTRGAVPWCGTATSTGCGPPEGRPSTVQYVRENQSVVLVWLQGQRFGEPAPALRRCAVDPAAVYECRERVEVHRNAVLLHHGSCTGMRGGLDVSVIRLRRIWEFCPNWILHSNSLWNKGLWGHVT